MAQFDNTKGAARRIQDDAQATAQGVRGDLRSFVSSSMERFGVVGNEARQLTNDITEYFQHWMQVVREDLTYEAKAAARSAVASLGAIFVASLGFLLVNMGVIWWLSSTDTGVGPWFVIFGCAWIALGAIAGTWAYLTARKATRVTSQRLREDTEIPRQHAQSVTQRLQEQRNESATTH